MLGSKRKRSPKEVIAQTMEAMGKMLLQIKILLLCYVPQCLEGLTSWFHCSVCGRKYYESFPGENTDAFSGQILQLLRDNEKPPEDAEPRESFVLKRNSSLGEMVREHLNHLSATDPAKWDTTRPLWALSASWTAAPRQLTCCLPAGMSFTITPKLFVLELYSEF